MNESIFKTNNFKFISSLKKEIDQERYYHLVFFINNFEEALLNREFHYIKLEMRYLYESIWKIIETGLRSKPNIQKQLGVTEYFIRVKSKRYGTISKEKHKSFSDLFKDLPFRGKMDIWIYKEFCETYRKLHQYLHYNEYTVDNIRGELRYSNIKLKDALNYGEFFANLLKWTIETIYTVDLSKYEKPFDKELYNNYEPIIDNFILNKDVSKIYNTKCELCKEGNIVKPLDRTFPFGPYLQCDNKKCNAILAKNLKLKSKPIKDENCPNENCDGEIKEIYNYPYKKRYKVCNACSHNTRNNIENVITIEEIKDFFNSDEKYKNIEEMYNSSRDEHKDDEEN